MSLTPLIVPLISATVSFISMGILNYGDNLLFYKQIYSRDIDGRSTFVGQLFNVSDSVMFSNVHFRVRASQGAKLCLGTCMPLASPVPSGCSPVTLKALDDSPVEDTLMCLTDSTFNATDTPVELQPGASYEVNLLYSAAGVGEKYVAFEFPNEASEKVRYVKLGGLSYVWFYKKELNGAALTLAWLVILVFVIANIAGRSNKTPENQEEVPRSTEYWMY